MVPAPARRWFVLSDMEDGEYPTFLKESCVSATVAYGDVLNGEIFAINTDGSKPAKCYLVSVVFSEEACRLLDVLWNMGNSLGVDFMEPAHRLIEDCRKE